MRVDPPDLLRRPQLDLVLLIMTNQPDRPAAVASDTLGDAERFVQHAATANNLLARLLIALHKTALDSVTQLRSVAGALAKPADVGEAVLKAMASPDEHGTRGTAGFWARAKLLRAAVERAWRGAPPVRPEEWHSGMKSGRPNTIGFGQGAPAVGRGAAEVPDHGEQLPVAGTAGAARGRRTVPPSGRSVAKVMPWPWTSS